MTKKLSKQKASIMLHEGIVHGKKITNKQRRYFGHVSNANIGASIPNDNDYTISAPHGWEGAGISLKGRHYSPAWGGSFQSGGMLPGMVGFMYSRDGAPANGKYAKKTLPSAQTGAALYPIEPWRKQGLVTSDTLQRGTMYRMPYIDQKKLYNTPIPKNVNPTDTGFMIASPGQEDPNILAKRKLKGNVNTYDIAGNVTSAIHPQGSNVNFQDGGMIYYQHGLDFKTKGMQDGGSSPSDYTSKLSLIKERNQKRDSVQTSLLSKYPNPRDYNKVNLGMLSYFQSEPEKYKNILQKKAKGGVIKDNMGQWNHPGKVTQIDSNRITMKGVNYPVLGISDLGDMQMMHPNGEYAFDGTQVTEYPIGEITKGSKQDKGQKKRLDQLTDFSNNNNMEQGKSGIHIKPSKVGSLHKHLGIAQDKKIPVSKLAIKSTDSPAIRKKKQFAINSRKWRHEDGGLIPYAQQGFSMSDIGPTGSTPVNLTNPNTTNQQLYQAESMQATQASPQGQGLSSSGLQSGDVIGAAFSGIKNTITGLKMLGQEKKQRQQAQQFAALSNVVANAASTRPERVQRKYVRPEDMVIQPNQLFPQQGVGTNYLSGKNGLHIGGEIQNTYDPNTLYTNLGYEPLDETNKVKQFQAGGEVQMATQLWTEGQQLGQMGGGLISGTGGAPSAGSMLGSNAGVLGGLAGGLLDQNPRKTKKYQQQGQQNLQRAALQEGVQNLQLQNSSFMENGGWVSHDWQPQVITKFGEHTMSELLKPDPMMNTLQYGGKLATMHYGGIEPISMRSGGHLGQVAYTPPTEEALQTYAMGGELQVHKNGYAENISNNPYLPGNGETVMFRGKSHENGGIPISYGKNPVEVEGGEPAVKLQDGGTGEDNLVVFGNMKIPHYGVNELGDKNAKNKKFKNYIADLSKVEDKQNKTINKGLKIVDETDDNNSFDLLKLNSGKLLMKGGDMKLQEIAKKKQIAANVQNAILDTAKEYGIDSDALAKGKVKKAKYGAKMSYAQNGVSANMDIYNKISKWFSPADVDSLTSQGYKPLKKDVLYKETSSSEETPTGSPDFNKAFGSARKQGLKQFSWKGKKYTTDLASSPSSQRDYVGIQQDSQGVPPNSPDLPLIPIKPVSGGPSIQMSTPPQSTGSSKKSKLDWINLASQIIPYFRPTNQLGLDPNQLSGEMFALASNQLDPVQAQRYTPQLDQPYDISLQDQLNANQSDFNSIQRLAQNNPAALASLAAQKYAANTGVLGEQFRLNQAEKANVYSKNRDILNDAQLKNLAIMDQQYVRQAQAKSNTKAIAQSALSSIADKIQQNRLENRTLGVYENLYNYRYDPQGRAINLNAPYQFNIPQVSQEDIKKKSRNGSIVRAIKNL